MLEALLVYADLGGGGLERAQRLGKSHLLVVVEVLIFNDQHAVLIHCGMNFVSQFWICALREIEPDHFGGKHRMQRVNVKLHGEWTFCVGLPTGAEVDPIF